jgi:hypothetical protein
MGVIGFNNHRDTVGLRESTLGLSRWFMTKATVGKPAQKTRRGNIYPQASRHKIYAANSFA